MHRRRASALLPLLLLGAAFLLPAPFARAQSISIPAPAETLGAKLRRLAGAAAQGNEWTRPQMRAPLPWQPSTAYTVGQVRVNGGSVYVCGIAGTSAPASGGGPTVTTSGQYTADGSAYWTYWGANTVTVDPYTAQTAWAASTAYALGAQVTTAGGGVYACVAAGTSAASGAGPSAVANAVADGSVTWTYLGPYAVNIYGHDIPAMTSSASSPASPLTNVYYPGNTVGGYAISAVAAAKGSGYALGDTITLSGGAFTTAAVLTVTGVSGGGVTAASVSVPGVYTAFPYTSATSSATGQASTSGSGSGATFYVRYSDPPYCRLRGAYNLGASAASNGNIYVGTFQPAPNAGPAYTTYAEEFWSDAPKIALGLTNGNAAGAASLVIDGARYSLNPIDTPGGASAYVTFDWSAGSASARKPRSYRLEMQGNNKVSAIYVDGGSQVWAPGDSDRVEGLADSDSLWAGSSYGPYLVGNSVANDVARLLGWTDIVPFVQGGTGYVNPGTSGGVGSDPFGFRLAEALTRKPDVWLFMGSTNDLSYTAAQVTAAALADFQAIRAGGSTAPIIVLGVWSLNDSADAVGHRTTDMETAVQAAVTAFNDPQKNTYFVPIRNDPYLPWVTGSWDDANQPSSANAGFYIAGDNTHPPDIGTRYLAQRIANAIRQTVLPLIP